MLTIVFPPDKDTDNLLTFFDNDPFHIGQGYDKKPAQQLQCSECGGREFHVAQGSYYTAIRCVKCRWEYCIHNG
jgi:hypothetical protein